MTQELPEVQEVVPGDYEVRFDDRQVRVLVPAGVGVPGAADEDLAGAVVAELRDRGVEIPDVVDVSAALRGAPDLLSAVSRRIDPDT